MFGRSLAASLTLLAIVGIVVAQQPTTSPSAPATTRSPATAAADANSGAWRAPGATADAGNSSGVQSAEWQPPLAPVPRMARPSLARVSKGPGTLPNEAGQEWRDYDISPYTTRVTSTNHPEQAIVDWILRETGYEAWHSEPLGLLSANRRVLRVYHTPEMHAIVSEMVDRFVNSEAESHVYGMHVVTVGSPGWRAKSHRMLHPVSVQSQGVQAWLLAKEDASLLLAELRRRGDFREHSSPHLLVNNGQSAVVSATRPRNYIRDILLRNDTWPGFEPQTAQIDEGFSLELNPLLSLDGRTIDAVIKCSVDHVEKMIPVLLEVPTPVAPRQRTEINVPQMTSCRLHERFRWPADQVLLISLGVVASPAPATGSPLGIPLTLGSGNRADLLVFVEGKGKTTASTAALRSGLREANNYRGRY